MYTERLSKVLRQRESGLLTDPELAQEVAVILRTAPQGPTLHGTCSALSSARRLVTLPALSADLVIELIAFAGSPVSGPLAHHPDVLSAAATLRDALISHVAATVATSADPHLVTALVASMPAAWCTPQMLDAAVSAQLPADARARVDGDLLPTAVHVEGPSAAFSRLVEPHLHRADAASLSLATRAYLRSDLHPAHRTVLRDHVMLHRGHAPTDALVPVAVRLSVEGRDSDATEVARHLGARDDLGACHPPILGLILWFSGAPDEAGHATHLTPAREDPFGWATQASRAVARFIDATDAPPRRVLELLLRSPAEPGRPSRSIAAVGALVGRLAHMRMRAYLALGDQGCAAAEAQAVVTYHHYRDYDLHLQHPDQELEVGFLDRLAVTEPELAESRAVAAGAAERPPHVRLHLDEGRLVPTEH